MPTVLITGANRGLGLEFARQYARDGWQVIACCRDPEQAFDLRDLPKGVELHRLDLSDSGQIAALAGHLQDRSLDLLIHSANHRLPNRRQIFGALDFKGMSGAWNVNIVGGLRLLEALSPVLNRSLEPRVVLISSGLGSIANNDAGGWIVNRMVKAATNMAVKTLSIDWSGGGAIFVALAPGWVRTDEDHANAPLSPRRSVKSMRAVIDHLTAEHSGKFLDFDGTPLPW